MDAPNQNIGTSAQIVHESETQRQFIRLKMPAQVELDGVRYTAKDLSSGGMAIEGFETMPRKSSRHDIKLILPFFDFALDIDLTAEVIHTTKKDQSAGFRFVDMSANQVSILNHVLSAFISGDIISGSSVLNVVARENFVKVRNHSNENDKNSAQTIKKFAIYGLFGLITLGLSLFIVSNIMNSLTVISSSQAYVSATTINVQSSSAGLYKSNLVEGAASVKKGQVMGNIASATPTETGISLTNALPILSPCDCFIKEQNVTENAYVSEGNTLYTLIPQKTNISVEAFVPMEEAARLKTGTKAKIRIGASGQEITGKVENLSVRENPDPTGVALQSLVTIKPDTALTHDDIDRPAYVEFFL